MTLIVKSVQKRWPGGCIVFRIQDDPNFHDAGRAWVKLWRTAIQEWSQAGTDLRFIERTVQDSFVTFVMDPGLSIQGQSEEVGMKGGEQLIRLAPITPDSDQVRTSRHELGHTIGMYHEHQRPDRDDFITIDEANIKDIFCWFRIMLMITDETMVENYNVRSIMHYSAKKECSKDGRTAIIKRKDGSELPKQGNSIKPTDIRSAAALNAGNLHIYQLSHGGQIEKTIQQANIKSGITAICPYALDARRFLLFLRHAGGRGGLRAANMNSDGSMGDRVAYKTVTSGWTAMDSYGILGSTFAFLYKAREGLAKVRRIEVNGNIAPSSTSPEMQLERGWTVVSHYAVGFNNFLIFVNSITGQAQVRQVSADGLPHDIVQSRKVFVGWTTVQAVHIGSKTYLYMLKASTGKVHIRRIQDNGKIGEVIHYGQIAPGFNIGIPYRVIGGYFLFLLNSDTGKVEIREICQDGSIGTVTDTRLFSTGWESAAIYDVDPGKYVVLIKPGS